MKKVGYITIVGNPNAGKSTLLNSFVEQKISIVSPKPQTTRDTLLGIWTEDECQMIFADTPGTIKPKNVLGEYMAKSIDAALAGVDCILLVIDGHDGLSQSELKLVDKYSSMGIPLVVAVSKIDITQPQKLMPALSLLNEKEGIDAVFCVSCRKNKKNVKELRDYLKKFLKEGDFYYDEDDVTNKSLRFLVCEQIREKILFALDQEVPHGVGIELNKMEQSSSGMWEIDANVIVEKQSHKPIILGKGGQMLKEIATNARISMEKLLENKVFLQLWVKVKPDWRDSEYLVNQIGYNKKDL